MGKRLLEEINTDIPESVSNIIMQEAIANSKGFADSNMRVIVIRLGNNV